MLRFASTFVAPSAAEAARRAPGIEINPPWRGLCALLALVALAGCGAVEGSPSRGVGPAPWPDLTRPDTVSVVPPGSLRDAVRVPYAIPAELDGSGERGELEAGSWAAFSILRTLHEDDPQGALDGALADRALPRPLRAASRGRWVGEDGVAYTADDRPFASFAELVEALAPSPDELGRLLWAARQGGVGLDPDPWRWHIAAGHAFSEIDAALMLRAVNACAPEELGWPASTVAGLRAQRPVTQLSQLEGLPRLSRGHLVRLVHHAAHSPCAGEGVGAGDAVVDDALAGVEVQRLRWLYTEAHFEQVVGELEAEVAEAVRGWRARGHREDEVQDRAEMEVERLVAARLRAPFADLEPAAPTSDSADALRTAAAEHLVHTFSTSSDALPQPWEVLLERLRDDLFADLAALRQGHATWTVVQEGREWIVYGRLWGLFCEVTIDLPSREVARVYVEQD